MIIFPFLVKSKQNQNLNIVGTFTQFDNFIIFINTIDGKSSKIQTDRKIDNPVRYLAHYFYKRSPDSFESVTNLDNSETVEILSVSNYNEINHPNIVTETVFKVNGFIFTEENFNSLNMIDFNGSSFSFKDITSDYQKFEIPKNGKYSKNNFINDFLYFNKAPINISRQIIANINSGKTIIINSANKYDEIDVFVSEKQSGRIKDRVIVVKKNEKIEIPSEGFYKFSFKK